jgi:tryptophan 2,3-dioxygenase
VSAGATLQTAIARSLGMVKGLSGVFDGPPARAAYPYVALDATTETDWSHKSGNGREVLVAVTLWDNQPVRLHTFADLVESALQDLDLLQDWRLVTLQLVRRRIVRDVAGPWAAAIDYRARMLAIS